MDLLLNELSLSGQYNSIDHFVESGIMNILHVFAELKDEDQVFKTYDFYSSQVTPIESIHDILNGSVSRSYDELRKFKIYLSRCFDKPYWEDDQIHDSNLEYLFGERLVSSTSLAESCERDKVIISFLHESFQNTSIVINKDGEDIGIDNLFEEGHYTTLLHSRGILTFFSLKNLSRFTRTTLVRQGKAVYQEIASGNYWYLDNMHKNHFEVFNANEQHLGIADLNGDLDRSRSVNGRTL